MCQIDLVRSLAALTNQKLPNQAGPDSVDVLPALLGESPQGRSQLVEQGRSIAVRDGKWKLIEGGAGGPNARAAAGKPQLFNLADDLAESTNLASQEPERVRQLSKLLDDIRKAGRMPSDK